MNKKLLLFPALLLLIVSCISSAGNQQTRIDVEYYPAVDSDKDVAIMFLGGGEGGMPGYYYDFEKYNQAGYSCLAVGYFGTGNTPYYPELIPLEYFYEAIKYFKSFPEVSGKKIVIYGTSFGGGFALKIASKYPEIEGVIANVPITLYLPANNPTLDHFVSDTTFNGEPVPYLPFVDYDYRKIATEGAHEIISLSLNQKEEAEKALITAEEINGPILLFSAEKDKAIPSTRMCNMLINRLDEKNFQFTYEHIVYENADHDVSWDIHGETTEGNRLARFDIEKRVFEFLERL